MVCIKHGMSTTQLYKIWTGIKNRCSNPKFASYKNYGGRGITVCQEWLNDSVAFMQWALSNGYKTGLQIDRIDNNGSYAPDNCRFVTARENANNRSNTIYYKGIALKDYCRENNLNYGAIIMRIYSLNWGLEKAITTPVRAKTEKENRT